MPWIYQIWEIVEGRNWLEEQREISQTERQAFQEEQTLLLEWIEKAEFLQREHDLLVRVLNERALLEIEKREFRQQRDADILREEAEHLEQCLDQAESAKNAMEGAKNEFERRSGQLNQLREVLSRYENLATRLVRSTQQKLIKK
uniref:Chromosome partition protein Smc n=1 Tax=Meloidogyne hapla TaxID=6305 RepID=A0A1I8BQ48_MELHA